MVSSSPYQSIREEIASTAKKCGRDASEISLIAVTKQVDWPTANHLYQEGQREFGENRVKDALEKIKEAPKDCRWHFIGNLQLNKVRKVVGKFALIHSVDSFELAKKISEVSEEMGVVTSILLQANTSGEISKNGLTPDEWKQCFAKVSNLHNLKIEGLMTMAPLVDDQKVIRNCFAELRKLGEALHLTHLSMGMSNDYKIAIEEGATFVRVGTALFK